MGSDGRQEVGTHGSAQADPPLCPVTRRAVLSIPARCDRTGSLKMAIRASCEPAVSQLNKMGSSRNEYSYKQLNYYFKI